MPCSAPTLADAIAETEPWLRKYVDKYGFQHEKCHSGCRTLVSAYLAQQQYENADKLAEEWLTAPDSTHADLNFSRLLMAGELALAHQNLGLANEFATKAMSLLDQFDSAAADEAGVWSLRGAIDAERHDWPQAAAALEKARSLLAASPELLASHQGFWPAVVDQRLAVIRDKTSGQASHD